VARARLYATALGVYEPWLNGRRVGDWALIPGWTDYRKRVQYQVYDVTELVRPGPNALGAVLGDGWYCGHVEHHGRQQYGDRPRLLAQLVVDRADGSRQTVATDGTWRTAFGPLLEADLLMGESYDARLDLGDWSAPGYDDGAWAPVTTFPDPGIALSAMPGPPVRPQEMLAPVGEPARQGNEWTPRWIYDLGQNLVGRIRLTVSGEAGRTITLRHAETLKPDGTLYTENLRKARQTDHYTLRGGGEEVWEPRFTFHGFRYVEVSGWAGAPPPGLIAGVVLHSDMPQTGTFECSDPLVNQLQRNIAWGQKGNFVDIPTDCPQRDERLGWLGDAQVFVRTAAFNRDVSGFFAKWLRDVADAQAGDGAFPMVAPKTKSSGPDGGPAWADAGLICPWTMFECYGDRGLLAEHYPALQRWMAQQWATSRDGVRVVDGWPGFGDWLALDGSAFWDAATPKDLIGTAFHARAADLMARVAALLDRPDDAGEYRARAALIRQAFAARFVTPEGGLTADTQTGAVLALHFDLLPPPSRPLVADALAANIRARGDHLCTGFVGTPYLAHVLADTGHLDLAYALLLQKTWPSWLYPVTQGATTIWERWDGWTDDQGFQDPAMNSFNHYAYGAIGDWLYAAVAGISFDPGRPGYRHVVLRPRPGGGLSHARAALQSPYGPVVSDWRLEGGRFRWRVEVPPNATATVHPPAPGAAPSEIGSGVYEFTFPWEAA
jgi:alpha-L-rhamnosidase